MSARKPNREERAKIITANKRRQDIVQVLSRLGQGWYTERYIRRFVSGTREQIRGDLEHLKEKSFVETLWIKDYDGETQSRVLVAHATDKLMVEFKT